MLQKKLNDKLAEEEQEKEMKIGLAELDAKLSAADHLLGYENELSGSESVVDIEEKARNAEEIERMLNSILDRMKGAGFGAMNDEQRTNAEKQQARAVLVLERIRALKDAIVSHLSTLARWTDERDEIEAEGRAAMDEGMVIIERYSEPQQLATATIDAERLRGLLAHLEQIMHKMASNDEHRERWLPDCKLANETNRNLREELEKGADNVKVKLH